MGGDGIGSRTLSGYQAESVDELVLDEVLDETELLEFLAADLDPVPVDPGFRERLREDLWVLVQSGVTRPTDH